MLNMSMEWLSFESILDGEQEMIHKHWNWGAFTREIFSVSHLTSSFIHSQIARPPQLFRPLHFSVFWKVISRTRRPSPKLHFVIVIVVLCRSKLVCSSLFFFFLMLLPAGTLSHKEKSAGSCGKSQRWHGLIYHHLGPTLEQHTEALPN